MTNDDDGKPPGPKEGEIEALLRRTWAKLQRILSHFGIPREDAEDLIQEVMVQLLRKWSTITNPDGWLPGALRNECRMYWRGRSRRRTVAVDEAILDLIAGAGDSDPERRVMCRGVWRWVEELPHNCRELLKMRYGLELNDREVAKGTGYKPGSVDKVTRRCIGQLTDMMTKKLIAGVRK
jgi:RNA polymerase sigma factor (sigma-70 family)